MWVSSPVPLAIASLGPVMEYAVVAVEGALAAGARYADARVMVRKSQSISARNQAIEVLAQDESAGVGVRALIGSSWGFFSTSVLTDAAARQAGERASAIARASARVAGPALELPPMPAIIGEWESECAIDPISVSLSDKGDLLVEATRLLGESGAALRIASCQVWDTDKWFASSEGHRIHQRLRECGAGMSATAIGDGETQRRSYPGIRGQFGTRGWELVNDMDLLGNAQQIGDEAVALLSAPQCPEGETDLILGSEQLALQIHESVGHAVELDRILGWEAAFAGTSWLDLSQLGRLRFGSELMTITADATLPGALGSFGFDDEGTPAASVDIVSEGTWVGVLSGRDSAALAGVAPGGMVRSENFDRIPMVRMTNIGLLPGPHSLDEIIAATDDGVFMETNRSWSIDDRRLNFQFGCEIAWEVKGGKRGRMLRNPTYTGISPGFWASLDMLAGVDEWVFWGTPNCGKGQPMQVGHTGHPASPARFRGVRVGVRG
jgi:TldD protein